MHGTLAFAKYSLSLHGKCRGARGRENRAKHRNNNALNLGSWLSKRFSFIKKSVCVLCVSVYSLPSLLLRRTSYKDIFMRMKLEQTEKEKDKGMLLLFYKHTNKARPV